MYEVIYNFPQRSWFSFEFFHCRFLSLLRLTHILRGRDKNQCPPPASEKWSQMLWAPWFSGGPPSCPAFSGLGDDLIPWWWSQKTGRQTDSCCHQYSGLHLTALSLTHWFIWGPFRVRTQIKGIWIHLCLFFSFLLFPFGWGSCQDHEPQF